jgi:signal transduction histidine kinase
MTMAQDELQQIKEQLKLQNDKLLQQEKLIEHQHTQLLQQEKLAGLGMLSAGISHELQNPLNFVINFSKLSVKLLDDLSEIMEDNEKVLPEADKEDTIDIMEDLRNNISKIAEHGDRAISIIQDILLMSRGKEDEKIPTDIVRLVKEYMALSYHAMRAKHKDFNIKIVEDYAQGLKPLSIVPQLLSRAVLNIMNNACYTVWKKQINMKDSAQVYEPTITVSIKAEGEFILIAIKDNGEGMSTEVKQRLFENFFTTKPVGDGTGLGMGITRDIIVNKLGGKLSFESEENVFTCFDILLPNK